MEPAEPEILSFVIKIHLEDVGDEAGRRSWRGYITHIPSGQRRYVRTLDAIPEFIVPYLAEVVDRRGGRRPRLERWLRRWRQRTGYEP